MFNPDEWEYNCVYNDEDGTVEWYQNKHSFVCISVDEYNYMKQDFYLGNIL